jgi:lipopolysaccharide transport system ATP-binding protein
MSDSVIEVDHLWKKYRLGVLGTGTLRHDFNRWLHRLVGKPDPYAKVGEAQKIEDRRTSPDLPSPISYLLPPPQLLFF